MNAEQLQASTALLADLKRSLRAHIEATVRRVNAEHPDQPEEHGDVIDYLSVVFDEAKKETHKEYSCEHDRLWAACAAIVATEMILEIQAEELGE